MRGFVSLVGAGPGDPDLLTQRAVRRLAEADVVFYDALVSPDVLPLAPRAQLISVGKRHGRHSVSQETIERCLVRAARRGKRVVRLKAGDPFVFGRGGEEALALVRRGHPVRGRARRVVGGRRAGARRHPGHPSRPGLELRRRLRPRRIGVAADRRQRCRRARRRSSC